VPNQTNSRALRVWIKAFLESLSAIVLDYKEQEIVEMLLFKLPWLCHGIRLNLFGKHSGSVNEDLSSQRSFSI
jgi:hypothetical protein